MWATAGIVLAGGRSARMGQPKAALDWHGVTLLRRTTGVLDRVVDGPVLVVGAPGQPLPMLRPGIEIVDDPADGQGPLRGIATGLAAVRGRARVAFVCAVDLPFLHPAFVAAVLAAMGTPGDGLDVALPDVGGRPQPLAAAYRSDLAPLAAELLAAGERRAGALGERCRVRRLTASLLLADHALAAADPGLDSLLNVNSPTDYDTARARPLPEVSVHRAATSGAPTAPAVAVRAGTVAAAAGSLGVDVGHGLPIKVNGVRVAADGTLPLFAGDVIAFG